MVRVMKQNNNAINLSTSCVRMIGVEPTCLAAPDPKSGASANFATSALLNLINKRGAKLILFFCKWSNFST